MRGHADGEGFTWWCSEVVFLLSASIGLSIRKDDLTMIWDSGTETVELYYNIVIVMEKKEEK
jgi:hypothetical protein